MAKILIGLLLLSFSAAAHVTVLAPSLDCGDYLRLEKSIQGQALSLEKDPTFEPPERLSLESYSIEALSSVSKVREVYAEIFKNRKMSPEEAKKVLDQFEAEDKARITSTADGNGIANTVYFVNQVAGVGTVSVLRATLIKKGEKRRLPLEKYIELPDGNRVELERAYNAPSRWSDHSSREIMMVMAQYFKKYFGDNNYSAYLLTDSSRARLYKRDYAFTIEERPELPELIRYLATYEGDKLYYRYWGHIEKAYREQFFNPFGGAVNLSLLEQVEQLPGMKDYIPNLVAQAILLGAGGQYQKASYVSRRLRRIGFADINEDYLVLWESRALYDPFQYTGEPERALMKIRNYLSELPLKLNFCNDRALLFVLSELRLLFSMEKFAEADALLQRHEKMLKEGMVRHFKKYSDSWNKLNGYRHRTGEGADYARLTYVEAMWDLGRHNEQFSTSLLYSGTYEIAAAAAHQMGYYLKASRYEAIYRFLKERGY